MRARFLLLVLLLPVAAGCDDMSDQPRYEAYEQAPLFRDGMVNQRPVAGTIARGQLEYQAAVSKRPALTLDLIERGRERFDIFCAPCHSQSGDGEGMIVQRGFPPPPSLHIERLRNASAEHFVRVITDGYGVMFDYADRVQPADRWAIAAYIQALQLSRHADVAGLPGDLAAALERRN